MSRKILCLALSLLALILFSGCKGSKPLPQKVIGEYSYADEIYCDFVGEAYTVGILANGKPAFVDPEAALIQMKQDYADVLNLIAERYGLDEASYETRKLYKTYGWQIEVTDAKTIHRCLLVSQFFDIYENSYSE